MSAADPTLIVSRPRRLLLPLAAGLMLAAGLVLAATMGLNHDAAWQLYAARALIRGSILYVDLQEFNLPAAYYLYLPAAALMEGTGMAARTALAVTVAVAALSSGWLVRRELDRSRIGDGTATAATVALLATWLVLPGADFGQRDHFVAILVLPYLVRAAERAARGSGGGDRIGAVLAGLLAGFAVAIKPHYLPALILVETWALLRAGGVRQGLDPAPAATAAVLVAAGADLMLRHPAFIRDILPAALTALEAYGGSPVRLLEPNSLMLSAVALGLGALLALDRRILGLGREARARAISFGLGCIGLWLAFLLQGKGWWYQAQPANVFFLMAAAMAVVGLASDADAAVLSHRRLARGAAAALLALGLLNEALAAVLSLQDTGMRRDLTARLVAAIRETEASAPVAAFSTSMYPTFPAVLEADADWVLRWPYLWPLPALVSDDRDRAAETIFRNALLTDLEARRPALVIVDVRPDPQGLRDLGVGAFDMLAWLKQDPSFTRFWSNYEKVGRLASRGGRFVIELHRRK